MAKRFVTEFVINGDASGGVRAFNDTRNSAEELNSSLQTGTQRSAEFTRGIGSASQELQVLRRIAAPMATLVAGMFTANTLKNQIDFGANLADINTRLGASTESLSQYNYVAKMSGVEMGTLTTAWQRQARRIAEAAQGTGVASAALKQLGLDAKELNQLAPEDQFERIAAAMQNVENSGERVRLSQKLWDTEGVKLVQIVNQGTDAIARMRAEADALGLTISNDTAQAMSAYNGEMDRLAFTAQGLAQTLLTQIVPSMTQTLESTHALIQELGGAERVVETFIDGSILLSGVLAGRVVGALAASAVATGKKIAADRTAAAQAALVAQQEQSAALAVARRAEAEQIAALNSARIAAQRAQAAQAEASAKLREVQVNQQIMASERALETERLKAQISATGRQLSLTRLAEIRRTEVGLVAQSTAAQQALRTAEQQTAASTRALTAAKIDAAKAAGASNAALAANTAAANTATTAHTALAGAVRLGRMAMAPLGGPLGVAAAAATAFYLFRDSSDDVGASLVDLEQPLDNVIGKFKEMNQEAQQAAIIRWGDRAEEEADKARAALGQIRSEIANLSGARIFGGRDEEQYQGYRRLLDDINAVGEGARNLTEVLSEAQEYMEIPDEVLRKLRMLAEEYSQHEENSQQATETLASLWAALNEVAAAADNAGESVNDGAPTDEAIDKWAKYNDQLRESIANLEDPSLLGRTNRALDGMGILDPVRRATTIMLEQRKAALEDQKKAQEDAARAARQAATEGERAAQRQAQAAQRAAEAQAKALIGIQQEMEPLLKDHATYIERLVVLDKALSDGTLTQEEYGKAVRWNAEQYQRAATGAEEYEKQTQSLVSTYDRHNQRAQQLQTALEQINQRYRAGEIDGEQYGRMISGVREEMQKLAFDADPAAQELAQAWEEASNRIDETFADAFAGAFDSFDSFADQLLDGFKRLLAELAYQATLKPIVVAFTGDMRNMMSGGSSGFGNTIGAARGLMSGSSLFGSGTAAASAGGLYAGANTGAAVGGLYGNIATSAATSTGIMSSITAGVSAAMPWIAGGLAIDSLIGGGITKAISSLFGSSRAPQLSLATAASHSGPDGGWIGHGSAYMQSALGNVGIADRGSHGVGRVMSGDDQTRLLSMIVEMDNALASIAQSPEELNRMAEAVQRVRINASDAAGIADQLSQRTVAAVGAIDGEFGTFIGSLGTDVDVIIARAQSAVSALNLLGGASENLNLQFDVSALGALRAADTIAQLAGGIDQLASIQDSYYQAFFSEAERAVNLERELTQVLSQMGYALPATRDGFRALVEQQNQLTESGQQNYVQLLQLSGAFDQLQTMLDNTGNGVDSFASRLAELNDQIGTLENDVRRAYQAFERQTFDQQLTLLGLMGDEQAALALQRERELQGIDPLLHETQRRIWGLEDEAAAQRDAARAGQEYARSIAQINDQLASAFSGINQWIDQRTATSGTPGMNLAEAGEQFARQLVLAQSGDRDALQSITQYADRYLTAGEGMYASGDGFQRIQQDVLDALSELPEQISPEQFLADEIRAALQQTVGELPGGIASSLHPLFDSIDLDASGLIDWNEFYGAFAGMASDEELRRIFDQLDKDGTGTISRLEALNRTNEATEGNTQTLEERAREQLQELHGLTDEMTRSTDQMITLNSSMLSLRDAIAALGVAQDDVARIEAERAAAEQAEQDRISRERQVATYTSAASRHSAQSVAAIGRAQRGVDAASLGADELAEISRMIEQYAGDDGLLQRDEYSALSRSVEALEEGHYRGVARTLALAARHASQAAFNERDAANVGADGSDLVDAAGINYWDLWKEHLRFDGSHKSGLWNVPFDGYIAELHKEEMVVPAATAGRLRDLPDRGLPMPNVPLPQFPQLGNDDVVQVLTDLRNENKQLRTDINRLLGDVKTNTGNTANAVASSAARAEQQRETQANELRDMARNSRVRGRTV